MIHLNSKSGSHWKHQSEEQPLGHHHPSRYHSPILLEQVQSKSDFLQLYKNLKLLLEQIRLWIYSNSDRNYIGI